MSWRDKSGRSKGKGGYTQKVTAETDKGKGKWKQEETIAYKTIAYKSIPHAHAQHISWQWGKSLVKVGVILGEALTGPLDTVSLSAPCFNCLHLGHLACC